MAWSAFDGKALTISDVESIKAEFLIAAMSDCTLGYDSDNKITSISITADKCFRLGYQENGQSKTSFSSEAEVQLHTGANRSVSFQNISEITLLQDFSLAEIQELLDNDLLLLIVNPSALNGVTATKLGSSNDIASGDLHYAMDYVSVVPNVEQVFGEVRRTKLSFKKTDMSKLIDGVGQNIAVTIP